MTYAGISRDKHPNWPGWKKIDADEYDEELQELVEVFYRVIFWASIRGDQIGFQSAAFVVYDCAVNMGVSAAVKIAQEVIGETVDGIMGPKTITTLNKCVRDEITERLFVTEFSLARVYKYRDICLLDKRRSKDRLNSNMKFLCGWINRVQKGIDHMG